jgi:exopolysaccharide biosynthesis polyprenyl glycosylphosphotransferase
MSDARAQRRNLVVAAVSMVADAVMLETAFLFTYWLRFYSGIWATPLGIPPLNLYVAASLVVVLVFLGIFYATGLYGGRVGHRFEDDLLGLFKGVVFGSLLVLAIAFFMRHQTFSRSFFALFFASSLAFLTVGRILAAILLKKVFRRGRRTIRVLLAGDSAMRERVMRAVGDLPGLGLEPVGWLRVGGGRKSARQLVAAATAGGGTVPTDTAQPEARPLDLPCLGDLTDIRAVVRGHEIDLVVLTLPFEQLALVSTAAAELANLNTDLQFVPDLLALRTSKMRLTEVAGIPFISVREGSLSGADRIVKRTFDLFAAGIGGLLLAPLLLVLAAAVKFGSAGPVLYRQARVGRDGREFTMFKFRSMRSDAEADTGPVWTVAADPRVTGVGRFLRRWSLDELPQLWNVLRGEMSLVGPRPERKVFVDRFSRQMPRYFERHRVKSGLTGWAQVNGLRGDTSITERTLYDLHYVENWSLARDVKILLMTLHHVVRGANAY